MELDPTACYRALSARDARYDGRFFVAVKTTGIYCRPICPARTPKAANCVFMLSAAAAQEAGFRPCLRCKPERAPDSGAWRGSSATVTRALALIEAGALDEGDVDKLASRLGMGERQLRRLFQQHLGAAPISVAQTRRLLLAKQLLHDTDMPMTEVALAAGFGSVRRFNEVFQRLYQRPPRELRRRRRAAAAPGSGLTLRLPYRPPYDWPSMQAALGFTGERYRRRVAIAGAVGSLEVAHAAELAAVMVTVRFPQLAALPAIIARVRRLFDLAADPEAISAVLARDARLAPLVAARPGLRVPGRWSAPADHDAPTGASSLDDGTERWRPWQAYALAHLRAAGMTEALGGRRGDAARLRVARRSSPIGEMLVAWDDEDRLHVLDFADCEGRTRRLIEVRYGAIELVESPLPSSIARALDAYFAGEQAALDGLPVASVGTPFQRQVWAALRRIPAGTTTSYGQLASALGRPAASRAVGTANGANLIALVVPCHRVIGADGAATGYAGGVDRKRWLLAHEGVAGWKEEAA